MAKTDAKTKQVRNALATDAVRDDQAEGRSMQELISAVTDAQATKMSNRMADAMDARIEYERTASGDSDTFQGKLLPKLNNARAKLTTPGAARVLVATNVDPAFVNRQVSGEKRYNIYAIQKVADVVDMLQAQEVPSASNAINRAVISSLFSLKKAGLAMTFELAKACCSKNYRMKEGNEAGAKHLTRHTVSPGTASTQSSSTMNALATLGIVVEQGGRRDRSFTLADVPAVNHLAGLFKTA